MGISNLGAYTGPTVYANRQASQPAATRTVPNMLAGFGLAPPNVPRETYNQATSPYAPYQAVQQQPNLNAIQQAVRQALGGGNFSTPAAPRVQVGGTAAGGYPSNLNLLSPSFSDLAYILARGRTTGLTPDYGMAGFANPLINSGQVNPWLLGQPT